MDRRSLILTLALAAVLAAAGCTPGVQSFARTDVDYSHIQRVAVCPFQNRSQDAQAGQRMRAVFLMQLLERGGLEVLAPGEVLAGLRDLRLDPGQDLSSEQVVALGERLQADAVFFGVIEDYGIGRTSTDRVNEVTATFSLAETETGALLWQSQVHRDGTSLWRKLFGGGSASAHDVSRAAVADALETLF